jgi:PAS domain S-box-containing protein
MVLLEFGSLDKMGTMPLKSSKKNMTEIPEADSVSQAENFSCVDSEALFRQSADPIMTLAPPSWKFTSCNQSALNLFMVESEAAFVKLGPWDLSPEKQPDGRLSAFVAGEAIRSAMESGSHIFDWTHMTTTGEDIICRVLLSRVTVDGASYLQATVRDISLEKAALFELKKKTEELNSIYQNVPVGILELDAEFRIVSCNPAFQKMLDYSEAEIVGRSMLYFTHPDDKALSKGNADLLASPNGKLQPFEKRYIDRLGKTVFARITSRVLQDSNSRARYLSTVENVTEQREREIENDAILETMADGLVIQDKDGVIEKFNPSALELLRVSQDQLLGRTSLDPSWQAIREDGSPLPGDEHPAMIALRTGEPVRDALMGLTTSENKQTWIRINAIPFDSPSGRRVVCTFSDVTALLSAQREIRFILDALKIGVWKFNPVTQDLHWDQSMYGVFDLHESDFSGHYQAWESTLTAESKSQAVEELAQALRGEKEFNTVFEIATKSRGRRFISGQATVIRDQAQAPIMMFGLNADITDQIKLKNELELERTKSLRNAKLASLGEMSAGIAHEINNPLAIISGAVGLLPRYLNNPEKQAAKIESIQKACDRIARIVSGLRKFSRTGDKSNFEVHNLNAIVAEAIALSEMKSTRNSTPVTLEGLENVPVFCDEVEIGQVLINLINNAIDAVKERPEKWVKVAVAQEPQCAILRVTDSGPGIPEPVRNRLFDPFFTTKEIGEGTGLGLSISKGILDEHKATISVVTECSNTCFEIRFPMRAGTENAA